MVSGPGCERSSREPTGRPTSPPRVGCCSDDADKVSSFFQERAKVSGVDDQKSDREGRSKSKREKNLDAWLGGRDSNPDTVVQRAVFTFLSASFRSVVHRFFRSRLGSRSFRFGALSCSLSLCVSRLATRLASISNASPRVNETLHTSVNAQFCRNLSRCSRRLQT